MQKSRAGVQNAAGRVSFGFAWFILWATTTTVAVPSVLYADGVPAAQISVTASGSITTLFTPGTVTGAVSSFGGSEASSATAGYSGGIGSASGSGTSTGGPGTPNSGGQAEVNFFFEVGGAAPGVTTVPLIFIGTGSTSASGTRAEANAWFETPGGNLIACSASGALAGICGSSPASYSSSIFYSASPNTVYGIEVVAFGGSVAGTGSWSDSVDPEVEIDPSFAEAGAFTLNFSPNFTSSSVPEPPTSLILGIGMLVSLLGAGICKRLAKESGRAVHR
jgi:hypothetical protein